jgi:hypothetical protein
MSLEITWMRQTWLVARIKEMRNAKRILVGKPKGKRPFRRRWRIEDVETECDGADSTG